MNPFFYILVILAAIVLWFLLSWLFKPLGKLVSKIFNDSVSIMTEEDEDSDKTK